MRRSSRRATIIAFSAALAAIGLGVYVMRGPIRRAAQIQIGDSPQQVHRLLGTPTAAFTSSTQLYPVLHSYTFTHARWKFLHTGTSFDRLPPVTVRAEWFEYASAGHLIYYDAKGVVDIYWGGT